MQLRQGTNFVRIGMAALLISIATWAHAQNTTSCAIAGTVTDVSGGVLPGVAVTITNQATGAKRTETSNSSGYYDAEALAPGDYTVSTGKNGFKTEVVNDIHLDPGQRRGLDVKLAVGAETQSVSVEADAEVVQTESAEAGGTITSREV